MNGRALVVAKAACIAATVCASAYVLPDRGLAQDRRLVPVGQAAGGRRVALVIGNDTYAQAPLVNARNDARTMAAALRALPEPFAVTTVEDATQGQMAAAIGRFVEGLRSSDLAVFYYAGHGVQVDQENYLVPVDYAGTSVLEAKLRMIPASSVAGALRVAGVAVLVLDACRDNPFRGARAAGGGLGAMEARGTLIAYATGAGQTASDNPGGGNGLFTQELVAALQEPGLTVSDVFRRVRTRVRTATNERQWPAVYDDLVGDVVLRPTAAGAPPASAVPPAASPDPDLARREELAFWESIKDSGDTALLQTYLDRYPTGAFAAIARSRLGGRAEATAPLAFREANTFYQSQDYKRAAEKYEEAVAVDPTLSVAYFYLGNSYDNLFQPNRRGEAENDAYLTRAIASYRKAADMEQDPKMRRLALEYLAAAYGPDKMNDPTQAEPVIQRMIRLDPQEPSSYFALAKIYEDAGDVEKAEKTLIGAKQATPNDVSVYLQLAGFYDRQEEFEKLIDVLQERARVEPNNPEAYYTIATHYWDKAYRDFRLDDEQKKTLVIKGLAEVDRALRIKPAYMEALTYKNLLLRLQANLETDPARQKALIEEADRLRRQAEELKKKRDEQTMR